MPRITFVCKENGRPYEPDQSELDCFLARDPVYKIVIGRNDKWYSSFVGVDTKMRLGGFFNGKLVGNLLHEYKVGHATRCKTDEGIYCSSILPNCITRKTYEYAVFFPLLIPVEYFNRKQGLCAILKCFPEERQERALEYPYVHRTQSIYVDSIVWKGYEFDRETHEKYPTLSGNLDTDKALWGLSDVLMDIAKNKKEG